MNQIFIANPKGGSGKTTIATQLAGYYACCVVLGSCCRYLHSSDKVLIPVLSSPNDIKACIRFVMALNRSGILGSGIQVALIGNWIKARTLYSQVLNDFLQQLDLPLVSSLRDTQNYVKVMDEGRTIFGLKPTQSARDLEDWFPILYWLDMKE